MREIIKIDSGYIQEYKNIEALRKLFLPSSSHTGLKEVKVSGEQENPGELSP